MADTHTLPGSHITDLQKPWRRMRARAGLVDVRIHDLRHPFASQAAMQGIPLPVVARLLGHAQVQMTLRYAHVSDRDVEAAAERIGGVMAGIMNGSPARAEATPSGLLSAIDGNGMRLWTGEGSRMTGLL